MATRESSAGLWAPLPQAAGQRGGAATPEALPLKQRTARRAPFGFVPLALFGPAVQTVAECAYALDTPGTDAASGVSTYSWKPADPIYVPPGMILEPSFENRGFLSLAFNVRISYLGRPASAPPSPQRLPYVTAWQSPVFTADGTEVEADSTEKDLVNALDVPLRVECILGRVLEIFSLPGAPFPVTTIEGNQNPGSGFGLAYDGSYWKVLNQTKIQLAASWGTKMIDGWLPWPAAFDLWTRSIPCPHDMDPGSFYVAQVRGGSELVACVATTNPPTPAEAQFFVQMSIVGSREVSP